MCEGVAIEIRSRASDSEIENHYRVYKMIRFIRKYSEECCLILICLWLDNRVFFQIFTIHFSKTHIHLENFF